jgi:hypothetical protein
MFADKSPPGEEREEEREEKKVYQQFFLERNLPESPTTIVLLMHASHELLKAKAEATSTCLTRKVVVLNLTQ